MILRSLAAAGALLLSSCASAGGGPRTVDLLKLIDPAKHAVAGEWKLERGVLVTPTLRFARVQIPYAPPAEYDLRAVVERKSGANSIVFGLVAGGRQFCAVLDAFERGTTSGIDLVDALPFPDNETAFVGKVLENGKPTEVLLSVRKDRLAFTVGGKKIVDWKADYSRATLYPDWKVPDPKALFLGAWTAPYLVSALELTPLR
jgi:hypothetical protein